MSLILFEEALACFRWFTRHIVSSSSYLGSLKITYSFDLILISYCLWWSVRNKWIRIVKENRFCFDICKKKILKLIEFDEDYKLFYCKLHYLFLELRAVQLLIVLLLIHLWLIIIIINRLMCPLHLRPLNILLFIYSQFNA